MAPDHACGRPIEGGGRCTLPPWMRPGGPCHRHTEGAITPRQRAAARRNGGRSNVFEKGFLNDEERALYDAVDLGDITPEELRRQSVAMLTVRVARALEAEARQGRALRDTDRVFVALLSRLEDEAPIKVQEADEWTLLQQARKVLLDHPELLQKHQAIQGGGPTAAPETGGAASQDAGREGSALAGGAAEAETRDAADEAAAGEGGA